MSLVTLTSDCTEQTSYDVLVLRADHCSETVGYLGPLGLEPPVVRQPSDA